jgi:hypothetical protein
MTTMTMHPHRPGTSSGPRRPRVICRMVASVDGGIVTEDWPLSAEGRRQYELVHATYEADGRLCGRVTMEQHFAAGVRPDAELARENDGPPREDYVALGDHTSLQVALAWLRARKPFIIPIPGTRRLDHLTENLGAVGIQLTSADLLGIKISVPLPAVISRTPTARTWPRTRGRTGAGEVRWQAGTS